MTLSQADFLTYTKAMIDLLEDPLFIGHQTDAKSAVAAIKEVMYNTNVLFKQL